MGEFQEKVDQFKQTIQEPGFTTDSSSEEMAPTIGGEPMDDGGPVESAPSDPVPTRTRKKTNTFKKRIDQLTYESRLKDQQINDLANKAREQEYLLSQQAALLENEQQHKNAYYENNLQNREASIINELKTAKEEGDIEKELALTKALAQVTAEQSTYGLYKNQLANKPAIDPEAYTNDEPNIYPAPYIADDFADAPDPYENLSDEAAEWLESNPWADPNAREYSPRLRNELEGIASELDETLRYNGYADLIGSREYFNSLNNLMAERYSIDSSPRTPNNRSYNSHGQSSVAPVSRRGSSMSDQYISNNPNSTRRNVSLTEDEYKIARNLQIKLPNGRYATGDEAVRRYADAKRMSSQGGSNKLVIE